MPAFKHLTCCTLTCVILVGIPSFHLHSQAYFCRMVKIYSALLSALVFLFSMPAAKAQKTVRKPFPGTKYMISLPDSFYQAERFVGLQNGSGTVSIMVSEVPTGIEHNVKAFTGEKLKSQGVEILAKEEVPSPEGMRYLYSTRQRMKQTMYFKLVLMIGDSASTSVFSGFVPETDSVLAKTIGTALKEMVYNAEMKLNPWDALSFSMEPSPAELKFVLNNAGGIIFSTDGRYPSMAKDHTTLVAGLSIRSFSPHNRYEVAKNRMIAMKVADSLKIVKTDSLEIDGMPGYELTGYGLNKAGEKELVFMVFLFETDMRYYMISYNTNADFDKHLAGFRSSARTFKRKK